jgi:hypothetical protein
MGILNYENDAINAAMLNGLKEAVKDNLKQILMETAEKEIEPIIEKVSERIKLNVSNWPDYLTNSLDIKLSWLIKKQ